MKSGGTLISRMRVSGMPATAALTPPMRIPANPASFNCGLRRPQSGRLRASCTTQCPSRLPSGGNPGLRRAGRRGGRVVEGTPLLRAQTPKGSRGFETHPLRQFHADCPTSSAVVPLKVQPDTIADGADDVGAIFGAVGEARQHFGLRHAPVNLTDPVVVAALLRRAVENILVDLIDEGRGR